MGKHSERTKERYLEKKEYRGERCETRDRRKSRSTSRSPSRVTKKNFSKDRIPNRNMRQNNQRRSPKDDAAARDNRKRRKERSPGDRSFKRKTIIKQEPLSPENATDPQNLSDKEKPNFELSGKLAEDTNVYNGIVIKYNEPLEARKPRRRWRLYPFKGDTPLPMIPVHRQSAYLLGRERRVADIPIDHPSCSKQHAVLQYRLTDYIKDDDSVGRKVRPYIIDLESANGTFVNNQKIEARRYVELLEKDVVKFGFSSREYVVLHEESKDEILDDNVIEDTEGE